MRRRSSWKMERKTGTGLVRGGRKVPRRVDGRGCEPRGEWESEKGGRAGGRTVKSRVTRGRVGGREGNILSITNGSNDVIVMDISKWNAYRAKTTLATTSTAGTSTPARFLFAADVLRRCIAAILSPETARETGGSVSKSVAEIDRRYSSRWPRYRVHIDEGPRRQDAPVGNVGVACLL